MIFEITETELGLHLNDRAGFLRTSGRYELAVLSPLTALAKHLPGTWLSDPMARLHARIGTKLLVAFLSVTLLMLILGALGLGALFDANERTKRIIVLQKRSDSYQQFQVIMFDLDSLYAHVFTGHREGTVNIGGASAPVEKSEDMMDALGGVRRIMRRNADLIAAESNRIDGLVLAVTDLNKTARLFRRTFEDGNRDAALEMLRRDISPKIGAVNAELHTITSALGTEMRELASISDGEYEASRRWLTLFSFVAVGSALLLGYTISSSIIRPVQKIRTSLREVADGNFETDLKVENRDELGELAQSVRTMAAKLGQAYGELEAANQHKSQLLANMSHELRTPMNSILGYTELIQDGIYGEPPEKIADALGRIDANGKNLLALINDVLDISKIEAGQMELQIDTYKMDDVVSSVLGTIEPLAAEKSLTVKSDIQERMPTGTGDAARLRQVVLNIVGNAVKFTQQGSVSISAKAENGQFTVLVTETGAGISEADQMSIFHEFQQADNTSTRASGGTGLGLSISKRMIEMHGGRIWVDSNLGTGSTFGFEVPILADAEVHADTRVREETE